MEDTMTMITMTKMRLGKLGKLESYPLDNGFGWRLEDYRVVDIKKGDFDNPVTKKAQRVVALEIAIEEGEGG
jgi:hypothetical protein